MSAGNSQAPSVIKSCRDGGTEPSPLLAAGAGAKNIDPACAGPCFLLIFLVRLCVWTRSSGAFSVAILSSTSATRCRYSHAAQSHSAVQVLFGFFVFLYGLPLVSGFPADASRRRFRIWSAQGWLDSGRLCRARGPWPSACSPELPFSGFPDVLDVAAEGVRTLVGSRN